MTIEEGLTFFAGFFAAMGLVNVTSAVVLRSSASATYAALMSAMVGIMFYSMLPTGPELVHAALFVAYLICTIAFAFTLLRTWRYDRVMGWIVVGVTALNIPLVFIEFLLNDAWTSRFYAVDQAGLDLFLLSLIVLGFRALTHEGPRVAGAYLIAFFLPAIGSVIDDLATNHIIPRPLQYSFTLGVAWEALFFAFAVAMRNRGVQTERDRFEQLARIDGLTGVANRRTFDEDLERMWTVARRARAPLAIVMIDIDFFKALNDSHGHQAGDDCLRRVAALCEGTLRRSGDCFARYGGEEFSAVLFNADLRSAAQLAERVRDVVESNGEVTISLGVAATVPRGEFTPAALVAAADAALYRAKEMGRNRVMTALSIGDDPGIVPPMDLRLETP